MHSRNVFSQALSAGLRVAVVTGALMAGALRAQPTLTVPATSNLGAGQVTLTLKSSATGTGYFTLLEGSSPAIGTGAQTKVGLDGPGGRAARFGSLKLTANTATNFTLRNLRSSTQYTICFTADNGTALQGTVATKAFATAPMPDLAGRGWGVFGERWASPGDTTYNDMALAPDGTPYVAYQDTGAAYALTVRKFDGATWVDVGPRGFSGGMVRQLDLAIAPDGAPWIAYADDNSGGGRLVVRRFNGSAWAQMGSAGLSSGFAYSPHLAFAPDGAPHVIFSDPLQDGSGYKAKVLRFNGSSWAAVGPAAGFSTDGALYTTLAFAPDGTLYAAYEELATAAPSGRDGRATVMKYTGSGWTPVGGEGFTTAKVEDLNVAIGLDGVPYVAFQDYANGQRGSVMRFDGGAWTYVGTPGFTVGMGFEMNLVFAPNGVPWIALSDTAQPSTAHVYRFEGGNWGELGSAGCALGYLGCYTALAFAPDGSPRVQFHAQDFEGRAGIAQLLPPGPTTYAAWVAANFSAADQMRPDTCGPLADPEGTGVTNLQRYAHLQPAHGGLAVPAELVNGRVMIDYDWHYYHSLRFTRRSCAPDLTYTVEASTDLVNWATVSTWNPDASLEVQALDTVELGSVPRRFLRLRVDLAAAAMKVLVPAYFYPVTNSPWTRLANVAATTPAGTIYAIANVNNGPDSGQAADIAPYQQAITGLHAGGGRVLGYVSTSYGARAVAAVKADIDLWYSRFGVDGIFLDEQATALGQLPYYRDLHDHIKAKGGEALVVGNPGTETIEGYMDANDVTCVFESDGPGGFPGWLPLPWAASYPASKFYVLPYNSSATNMATFVARAAANNAGWIYVTDDTLPNPWDTLLGYFEALAAAALLVR